MLFGSGKHPYVYNLETKKGEEGSMMPPHETMSKSLAPVMMGNAVYCMDCWGKLMKYDLKYTKWEVILESEHTYY